MPKQKKRRKVEALSMGDKELAIPVIAPRPRASTNNPAADIPIQAQQDSNQFCYSNDEFYFNFTATFIGFFFRVIILNFALQGFKVETTDG